MPGHPLIVTVELEARAFRFFDDLRQTYYPAELNRVPAHISLFHHLPEAHASAVRAAIAREAGACVPPALRVAGIRHLGRGVAYRVESDELTAFRARLAKEFDPWLIPQDRQPFRPHITVQNKVEQDRARILWRELEALFHPFSICATGVNVWRYLGGPWELIECLPFGSR